MSINSSSPTGEFSSNKGNLSLQCESIIKKFTESDEIVQTGRNTLKKVTFEGCICVVKAFFIPRFPQNFSYGILSTSKAKKSYDNAKKLLKLGFQTPEPIGYFEYRSGGKLRASYYICKYATKTQTLNSFLNDDTQPSKELIQQFAKFCHCLHINGILHRDFNPKNILVSQTDRIRKFDLVDINRITWSKALSLKQSMASLSRLPFSESTRNLMLEHYASIAGERLEQCRSLLKKSEWKNQRYFRNKKRLRKLFPKK